MSSTDQNTSNTLFTSSPFDGIKGQRWHQFVQAFKAGAAAEFLGEDDESIWDACTDVDTGGNGAGATAMPAAGAEVIISFGRAPAGAPAGELGSYLKSEASSKLGVLPRCAPLLAQ